MDATRLKQKHRAVRDTQPEALRVRVHRAISWLARAERETGDPDARFLFLWIAFNAAYASAFGFEASERAETGRFIDRVLGLDRGGRLHGVLFEQFSGPVRTLIGNPYVYEPFWRALREHDASERWKSDFDTERKRAFEALLGQRTDVVLRIVLDRLHTLRNQTVHGGATWNSSANRAQLADAARILGSLMPVVIDLLIEAPVDEFGEVAYPLVAV